jgi:hypothetical protein
MDQIWTFNLVYIYVDWSFCSTYNVFSFSGIWFILYLVSMTYTYTPLCGIGEYLVRPDGEGGVECAGGEAGGGGGGEI